MGQYRQNNFNIYHNAFLKKTQRKASVDIIIKIISPKNQNFKNVKN